jgi:hypothetical protein
MVSFRILVAIASFSGETGRRGFHHHVEVIAHEAESVNLPAGFQARLSQGLEELLPVNIIMIDVLSPVAPAQDACPAVTFSEGG